MGTLIVLLTVAPGCASNTPAASRPANPVLIMASTTSTGDSGLMDVLLPVFQNKTGYTVKPIYVGSGAAMTLGERGEADVLLLHAPDSEVKFMQAGHGIDRKLVMHNDFILIGPAGDPAGIMGMSSATGAFREIAAAEAIFISRGDNSGTDQIEKKLWKTAAVEPGGQAWYQETGQGMGATLSIAAEKRAYTLTDRATFLARQRDLGLELLVENDPLLLNIYHVIQVNPAKSDKINAAGARAFAEFMVDPATQEEIGKFGVDRYGSPLFFPDAGKKESDLGSV
ncbi:MAG: substrate-binding domain-containing protein [Chloroflexi bacterium]|nr:substrate-binding domain-containing protein [Chloroflexota bacterium]